MGGKSDQKDGGPQEGGAKGTGQQRGGAQASPPLPGGRRQRGGNRHGGRRAPGGAMFRWTQSMVVAERQEVEVDARPAMEGAVPGPCRPGRKGSGVPVAGPPKEELDGAVSIGPPADDEPGRSRIPGQEQRDQHGQPGKPGQQAPRTDRIPLPPGRNTAETAPTVRPDPNPVFPIHRFHPPIPRRRASAWNSTTKDGSLAIPSSDSKRYPLTGRSRLPATRMPGLQAGFHGDFRPRRTAGCRICYSLLQQILHPRDERTGLGI